MAPRRIDPTDETPLSAAYVTVENNRGVMVEVWIADDIAQASEVARWINKDRTGRTARATTIRPTER